jgi:hypothetical protein
VNALSPCWALTHRSLRKMTFLSTWALEEMVPASKLLTGPETSPGTPLYHFLWNSEYWESAGTLSCGLEQPTKLIWSGKAIIQVSASTGAHHDVLPTGGLGLSGSPSGWLHVPPSFILLRGPVFSGEQCWDTHPSTHSFTQSGQVSPAWPLPQHMALQLEYS